MNPFEIIQRFKYQAMPAVLSAFLTLNSTMVAHAEPQISAHDVQALEIVALGDSLTAGYLLPPDQGFPEQLSAALATKGLKANVHNAGVSGDTSSGGLARLDWAVGPETDALILALGSNDALRGIEPDVTRNNLETIITRMKERNIQVLLVGMQSPPNMGQAYAADFNTIFETLAKRHGVLLYPFFLDGVAAQPELNLPDGMHPTGAGVAVMVEKIMPSVEQLITVTRGTDHIIN